ncbi:MAG: hypothetical protein Q7R52_05200 [archaeon]|nr:hypothetical protein [archaeon]
MYTRAIENLNVLLEMDRSNIEAWTYAFNSETDHDSKTEFRNNLYESYFDYYTNLLTFHRVFNEYENRDDIDFDEGNFLRTVKTIASILNNFDDLFKIKF